MHNGKTWSEEAHVVKSVAPRSYNVVTPEGVTCRRNRKHLLLVPEQEQAGSQEEGLRQNQTESCSNTSGSDNTLTPPAEMKRSGREVKAMQRLIEEM